MFIESVPPSQCAAVVGLFLLAYYLVPYLLDPYDYSQRFSGPRLAAFTNWWMSKALKSGNPSAIMKGVHDKYGTFVRVGPNHISIADPDAQEAVYGHGSGLLKADFYRVFQHGKPDMFNTVDRAEHTKKRRRMANIFSQQNVLAFQPRVSSHIRQLCEQLDMRCDAATRGVSGFNWVAANGLAVLDCCQQFGYCAFDIIGDLALGSPFGMIQLQRDATAIGQPESLGQKAKEVPVITTIAGGGKMLTSIGVYPTWAHHWMKFLPWSIPGLIDQITFFKMTAAAVAARLKGGSSLSEGKGGVDLLDKLLELRNEDDSEVSHEELIAEAVLLLIAGGDTTSNSLGALCYYLATHPEAQRRLQDELDLHAPMQTLENGVEKDDSTDVVVDYEQVKSLPYLNACLKEAMRLHATVGIGLPRVVPPGKTFTFGGKTFKSGSVISVPSFVTNRARAWGSDAEEFRPERWLEDGASSLNRYFVPFSTGPRACVGRNLAMMDLLLIAATVFRRYDFQALPTTKLRIREAFIREAAHCEVAVKRRRVAD